MTDSSRHPLPCSCCPRPFAELIKLHNGDVALLIKARHDSGEKHPNVLTLEQLRQMVEEFDAAFERAPGITKNNDGTYTSLWNAPDTRQT